MVSKKALILAASVALTTTFSTISTVPAYAFIPANEIIDIHPGHWSYTAIQALIEKYEILEAFPDKTFRGEKGLTRYEFAAALYKVMTRMEELLAATPSGGAGAPINIDKADLETIASLQREFRAELARFRGQLNRIESRMKLLEKVRLGGMIDVRYRDRLEVTDAAINSSPLVGGNPDQNEINSPARNFISRRDRFPFRVRTHIDLMANIFPEISYTGRFSADEVGFLGTAAGQQSVFIGGHSGEEGMLGSPVYVSKSFVNAMTRWGAKGADQPLLNIKFGLYNFSEAMNPGTTLKNHFNDAAWLGHGYGLVGWGGDELRTTNQDVTGQGNPYINSVSRYWVGDINASRVDPNSKRYNQAATPGVSLDFHYGPLTLFFGANNGSFYTSRLIASQGNLAGFSTSSAVARGNTFGSFINANAVVGTLDRLKLVRSNLLDLPADLNDGYGVLGADLDLGRPIGNDTLPVRLGVYGMDYWNDAAFALSGTRKELSAVVDIGTNALGGTAQLNSSFSGYDMASGAIFANNVANSGIDVGLGGKVALRSLTDLQGANFAAANAGGYVALPDFGGTIPRVLFAVRQSFGDTLGTENGFQLLKDSGVTISLPFRGIAGSGLDVTLEYNALIEGGFFSGRFMAHDVAVYSRYHF